MDHNMHVRMSYNKLKLGSPLKNFSPKLGV